jgi:hypothetical protein
MANYDVEEDTRSFAINNYQCLATEYNISAFHTKY